MKQKSPIFLFLIIVFGIFTLACNSTNEETPPKYVFLFIGDGMGLAHVTATENYLAAKAGTHGSGSLSFTQFPAVGLVTTYSNNTLVTCSAAAATALATGHKTNNGMLGTAPDSGRLTALTYPLHEAGYKTGIATSVSIDHATPGGFYAHAVNRNLYYDIASQVHISDFDFFAGSGFIHPTGRNNDQPDVYETLQAAGYTVFHGQAGLQALLADSAADAKVLLVQAENKPAEALPYAIDRQNDDLQLKHLTEAAIARLNNPKGFFAMIEGGKIDWAAHENDGATVVHEVIDFAEAVQVAVDFYHRHPSETLIIVTADHETGGMTVGCGNAYTFHPLAFDTQTHSLPYPADENDIRLVEDVNAQVLCGWTSKAHTGGMVPVYAIGAGSKHFAGKMDNTAIPARICALMGVALPQQ